MDSKATEAKKLIFRSKAEIDVSNLLIQQISAQGRFIEEVELKPSEQARVFLGTFQLHSAPKGFSIILSPEATEGGEIIKHITKLELQDGQYELVLHIANYSNKVVSVEVWKSE